MRYLAVAFNFKGKNIKHILLTSLITFILTLILLTGINYLDFSAISFFSYLQHALLVFSISLTFSIGVFYVAFIYKYKKFKTQKQSKYERVEGVDWEKSLSESKFVIISFVLAISSVGINLCYLL
jgi:hypothetical protein